MSLKWQAFELACLQVWQQARALELEQGQLQLTWQPMLEAQLLLDGEQLRLWQQQVLALEPEPKRAARSEPAPTASPS